MDILTVWTNPQFFEKNSNQSTYMIPMTTTVIACTGYCGRQSTNLPVQLAAPLTKLVYYHFERHYVDKYIHKINNWRVMSTAKCWLRRTYFCRLIERITKVITSCYISLNLGNYIIFVSTIFLFKNEIKLRWFSISTKLHRYAYFVINCGRKDFHSR